MNKKTLFLAGSLVMILATLTACSSGMIGRSHGTRSNINNENSRDIYSYDLPEGAKTLTLDVQIQADQGNFSWQVIDPDGVIANQGTLEAVNQTDQRIVLTLIPGKWSLEMIMEQASGSYDIEWRSR